MFKTELKGRQGGQKEELQGSAIKGKGVWGRIERREKGSAAAAHQFVPIGFSRFIPMKIGISEEMECEKN